ncbi:MAG: hypothetical protein KBS83_02135 [Lachnospiraceae bacterium]|nr:hypothetical protein [Candidatus Equihabitans merdae]
MNTIFVIAVTAVIFLAMILQLAGKPSFTSKVTSTLLVITAVGGLSLYGYGFSQLYEDKLLAVVRTLWAVCGMFVGRNEVGTVASLPLFQNPIFVSLLWLMHLFALYTLASAAITTVGANALRALRLMMARRGELTLIFGTNPDAINFGRQCNEERNMSVVFVSGSADASAVTSIASMGASLRTDQAALHPTEGFLRSIGIRQGRRSIHVYGLDWDTDRTLTFATELLAVFEKANIDPARTSITIVGEEEGIAPLLQVSDKHYGFGFVNVFRMADQAARLLVEKCPPWETIHFDENAAATEDFDALIIGFGQVGQSVLRQLVMNGQYEGSHFHVAVMAKDYEDQAGYMRIRLPAMFEHYNVEFVRADGRGIRMFEYILEHKDTLRYISVCIGDESTNREVATDIMRFVVNNDLNMVVSQCSYFGVSIQTAPGKPISQWPLFCKEVLSTNEQDKWAMAINHTYNKDVGRTVWEDWVACDYFGRMSSRASADFMPAMLKAVGCSEEDAKAGKFAPTPEQLENLGRTEHLRWCAFHYAFGFVPMSQEEYDARVAAYLKEKEETGKGKTRIGKNMANRTHACMVPWEELDALSDKENAVTGGHVDYKQMDIENVETIASVFVEMT